MEKHDIYIASSGIVSPLGIGTAVNFAEISAGETGISLIDNPEIYPIPFHGSIIDDKIIDSNFAPINKNDQFTKFEKIAVLSVVDANKNLKIDLAGKNTVFCLSTTKGNIELFDKSKYPSIDRERIRLWKTAEIIKNYFNNPNDVYCISNACISGLTALVFACGLLGNSGLENVVVVGADLVTSFVVSGFFSFQAISPGICRPFDEKRDGINLGEAATAIILSKNRTKDSEIAITGNGISNDANHISGPSRTGDGLFLAIDKALAQAGVKSSGIDFISAHGTATLYNDEMESKAFNLAGLQNVPLNSLKGYYGHTLGAAGLLETAIAAESLSRNFLVSSKGFERSGTSEPINVITKARNAEMKRILKTASGFGGSNAALILEKL